MIIAAQLALLLALVRGFRIENPAFLRVLALCFGGFLLHFWLPVSLRLPGFVVVSLAGIFLLFGPADGGWMLAFGGVLIGVAHIPIRFALRVPLIAGLAVLLALMRGGRIDGPWPSTIWPIFGSMFMFRLIGYLYDLKNRSTKFGPWRALGYFFMLPNLCFPLFPVVDYKTFVASHDAVGRAETSQAGVNAIFRGLTQLLLYRLVYQHLTLDATMIESASQAALYLVRPYLLYLKISGSFHVIVGMLQIYGFSLPRTNYNYFLASSFTDYWRRINIYWKEFIQKIFFNPVYFRLSRMMSPTRALVLATLIAFVATWSLHSYQWFWIRNSFPIVWQDIVFWSFMGFVVLLNMLWESKFGRRRSLKPPPRTWGSETTLALRTIATFGLICGSWAVWSVQSWGELQIMAEHLIQPGVRDLVWIFLGMTGLGLAAVLFDRWDAGGLARPKDRVALSLGPIDLRWTTIRVSTATLALLFLAYAPLLLRFDSALAAVVDELKNPLRLSGMDAQALDRGYYEDLTDVARFNPELAELYSERPADWERCWALQRTGRFPTHQLLPSRRVAFKGSMMGTNAFAMRDREYTQRKPANTYRIAMHGASHAMGTGVKDDQSFENLAEDRLNAVTRSDAARVEILNFSVAGYGPLARLYDLERRILDFEPDALLLIGINDIHWAAKELLIGVSGSYELPWPELYEMAEAWGFDASTNATVAEARMRPHRAELLGWVYTRILEICEKNGMTCYLAALPQPRQEADEAMVDLKKQLSVAEDVGIVPIDLLDAYGDGPRYDHLHLAKWDRHPNAEGHRLIGDRLVAALAPYLGRVAY